MKTEESSLKASIIPARHWMLVDDDEIILALLQYLLSTVSDAETHCFSSGAEALAALEKGSVKYEAVFTDYNMPGMNGLELCRRLRQLAPNLPVVLATGSVELSDDAIFAQGFCALVPKPFSPATLRAAVAAVQNAQPEAMPKWELSAAA